MGWMLIGGVWLKGWIQAASAMSNLGLFEAEMSSDAFQLLGMSEMGMLPAFFAQSILCSATGVIFLSWMSFQEIIEFLNFYTRMLLEFAAFVKLRIKKPDLNRPYRVPLNTFGTLMLCLPPSLLLILVMVLATVKTFFRCDYCCWVLLAPVLKIVKEKRWARFIPEETRPVFKFHPSLSWMKNMEMSLLLAFSHELYTHKDRSTETL
ncbi:LOW QUALITY PROTEIN: hypothetical protein HID58_095106 [Brassica napus]|uniref:Uncharacterized protein n=1 Tax=Brassica napus TaxID=3708 RepID=A0ABQ7X4S2_BRANA|nr:LOW QUALITY PROTEIN: hypothetical protein HID58_095106 [Brassica napus]